MKKAVVPGNAPHRIFRWRLAAGVAVAALMLGPDPFDQAGAHDALVFGEAGVLTPVAALDVLDEAFIRPIADLVGLALPESPDVTLPDSVSPDAATDKPTIITAALSTRPIAEPETLLQTMPATAPSADPVELTLTPPADELSGLRDSLRPSVPGATAADVAIVRAALVEYRKGNLPAGDALAEQATDEAARLAMEWAALRSAKQRAGFRRLAAFSAKNPTFPMIEWISRRAEEALFVEKPSPGTVLGFFAARSPEMAHGKVALARALGLNGDAAQARELVVSAWRDHQSTQGIRAAILKEFPGAITAADHRYLAERLIYEGQTSEGLRVATGAGPSVVAALQVLAASINENGGAPALISKLDAALQNDPAVVFSRIQALRRADRIAEAGQLMLRAPTDSERLVDGDEWWQERRILSRKLLDAGDPATAYKIAAAHAAESSAHRVDAETQAGWLALRFLGKPETAAEHFALARSAALTPASIARAAYWQGRAADTASDPMRDLHYMAAAAHKHTFYGQLALARLGDKDMPEIASPPDVAEHETATRAASLRAIRVLLDADARDLAQPLIADAAQRVRKLGEITALGDLVARYGLPRLTLLAGKLAMQRGLAAEDHAFPTFGIPPFEAGPASAEAAIVYSIARQESEFEAKAVSHAGARGLMQLMPATARRTAERSKIPFDVNQLTANPALNAQIGAAHLGELFGEYNGSYILSFAAYNAGGKRVKEWTTAYGDPRDPAVDKVDWIERIPIAETRHYVQKVLENLQVYRVRLNGERKLGIANDLVRGARRSATTAALLAKP